MKKVTFLLLLAVCALPASRLLAQQQDGQPMNGQPMNGQQPMNEDGGMLRVRLADETPISVALDGRYFRNQGRSLTVGDLPGGQHYLKIYTHSYGGGRRSGELIFEGNVNIQQGQMTVFVLNAYTGQTDIRVRNINPNIYDKPNYQDYGNGGIADNQGGNMNQGNDQNMPPNGYSNNGGGYDQNGNNPPNRYNAPPPNGYNDQGNNVPPPPSNSYQDNDANSQNGNNNDYNGNGGYRYGGNYNDRNNANNNQAPVAQPEILTTVDQPYLDKLKVKANSKITDTDKMKLLETSLKKQTVSTEQVSAIMSWLNFESSRVEFAKWAYAITVDKQNYQSLGNQFSYRSSRDELNDFVNSNR